MLLVCKFGGTHRLEGTKPNGKLQQALNGLLLSPVIIWLHVQKNMPSKFTWLNKFIQGCSERCGSGCGCLSDETP